MSINPELPLPDNSPNRFFNQVYRWSLALTLIGAVILGVSGSLTLALNYIIGVGANLMFIRITQLMVQRYLVPDHISQHGRKKLMVLLLVKLPFLAIVCGIVVMMSWFQPFGFLLGVSVVPLLILIYGGIKSRSLYRLST